MISLKELIEELPYDVEIIRLNNAPNPSIFLTCPKCGKKGKLNVVGRGFGGRRRFRISHEDGLKCHISWLDEEWELLDAVYDAAKTYIQHHKNEIPIRITKERKYSSRRPIIVYVDEIKIEKPYFDRLPV